VADVRRIRLTLAAVAIGTSAAGHAALAQPPDGARRAHLERLALAVQRGLRLDEAQAARLREVSARYARRRQVVMADEREARRTLRGELVRDDAADGGRVQSALAQLVDAQRRRVALLEAEQRELAAFLTPVQRARYLALQERALRAAQRARMQRAGAGRFGGREGAAPFD
jgi:Spy/CpxP family protein refolding chaperone